MLQAWKFDNDKLFFSFENTDVRCRRLVFSLVKKCTCLVEFPNACVAFSICRPVEHPARNPGWYQPEKETTHSLAPTLSRALTLPRALTLSLAPTLSGARFGCEYLDCACTVR